MKNRSIAFSVALALLGASLAPAAEAEHYGRHWGDAYHFHYDAERWRGGRWVQSWHGGHYGWWWLVGGTWLMYSAPVYPYPSPDVEPAYVIDDTAVQVQAPPPPPPAQVWYYCNAPQGYYPNVPACPSGWQTVPAVPQDLRR